MRRIYGFGETVLDIIFKNDEPVAAKPGGSVLNAFVSLGRLGWNPFFISEYGEDETGKLIDRFLKSNGVNTDFVNRFSDGQSALAMAFLDENNNANYNFYKNFPAERLQKLPADIHSDDIILFGSIYSSTREVRDSVVRLLSAAKECNSLIIYDPNFRAAHLKELEVLKPMIIENLEYADIIRGSDEDFQLIFGAASLEEAWKKLPGDNKILIYTENSKGVSLKTSTRIIHLPSQKIEPLSTIGAGDNFNAGLIHSIMNQKIHKDRLFHLKDEELKELLRTGILLASEVCMSYDNYISVRSS